ncbi:hypothetical protein C5167_006260 [Papaver somniferum]|uniref:Two-component response regulator n=1 Tax=Papaver somniferum TaxID=3469 RepID=A0A4Y7JGN3_PAPSO|nr:hypothetical protein C5167_006260 [Papaver somniferum]
MDATDVSCDSDLDDLDDLDVIRKRLSLSLNSAHSSPNTSDHMEDDAPAGLRAMVVDDNTACLFITSIMLQKFNYEVTGVRGGREALKLLKEKPRHFDLVISDLHMPEMNGIQLLRRIKRKYATVPVLLMSGDIKAEMVTRALENGAGYYLYKPVTCSDFEKLWQHVIKSKVDPKGCEKDMESFCQDSPREKQKSTSRVPVSSSSDYNEGNSRTEVSRKRNEPSREQPGDGKRTRARSAAPKKRRVIWTAELHNHFLDAIEKLGVDKGVPKRILEYMRIPGLTRENVASHLQKYRIFVKKLVENNRYIEPSTVKSLASRAFHSNFATDEPAPMNLPQNFSQRTPKYSFGSFQSGSGDGNFKGLNTQTHSSHLSASMVVAGFQLGQSSITPMNNNNKGLMASTQQPRSTTSVAAGNASSFNHQNIVDIANGNQNTTTIRPSRSILNMSMGGGRSGRGTMQLVHQQNLMRWRNNGQSAGLLNTSTGTIYERGNFQRQNNNAYVANMGTTSTIDSSFVGNSAQPSTLNSTNFTGIQIINDNTNSRGTLHIGPMVSTPSNDNNVDNMDYSFTNMPTSLVTEVPGLVHESPAIQSSYSVIEEPNSDPDYLNSEPSSVAPVEVSNPTPQPPCMNTNGFTVPQDEASFRGGIIPNANHQSISPQEETQVPTVPVAPAPLGEIYGGKDFLNPDFDTSACEVTNGGNDGISQL